jgi:hypothetical protein
MVNIFLEADNSPHHFVPRKYPQVDRASNCQHINQRQSYFIQALIHLRHYLYPIVGLFTFIKSVIDIYW